MSGGRQLEPFEIDNSEYQQLIAGLVEDAYDPLPREAPEGDCRLLKRRVAFECGGCTTRWRTCGRCSRLRVPRKRHVSRAELQELAPTGHVRQHHQVDPEVRREVPGSQDRLDVDVQAARVVGDRDRLRLCGGGGRRLPPGRARPPHHPPTPTLTIVALAGWRKQTRAAVGRTRLPSSATGTDSGSRPWIVPSVVRVRVLLPAVIELADVVPPSPDRQSAPTRKTCTVPLPR